MNDRIGAENLQPGEVEIRQAAHDQVDILELTVINICVAKKQYPHIRNRPQAGKDP